MSGNIECASRQVSRRFGIVQFRLQKVGFPAAGPDCGNDRFAAGYIAPGDQYARSTTSQCRPSRFPDAARRPSDKGGFANEVLISRNPFLSSLQPRSDCLIQSDTFSKLDYQLRNVVCRPL